MNKLSNTISRTRASVATIRNRVEQEATNCRAHTIRPTIAEREPVLDLAPAEALALAKELAIGQIKTHMGDKLENILDIEYPPGSGKKFSVDFVTQQNWHALNTIKDDPALISYPYKIRTKNEADEYSIQNSADVTALWTTVVQTVKGELDIAQDVISNIINATSLVEIQDTINSYIT